MKNPRYFLIAMLGMALTGAQAHAELLVYEPLNYSVGSLTDRNGGKGFASGWLNSNGVNDSGYVWDETTNVTFNTLTLNWSGVMNNGYSTIPVAGARYLATSVDGSSNLNIYRELSSSAGDMAGAGGVLWVSTIYHLPNRTFGAGLHIGLASGFMRERSRQFESTNTQFIGVSPYSGSSNVWQSGNLVPAVVASNAGANAWENFSRTVGPALPAEDMILVMKFTFGASDTVEAIVFSEDTPLDDITEAAFEAGKTSASYAAGIDQSNLKYLVINQGRFNNALDEVRIGTTFESVVTLPPPGPADADASTVVASVSAVPADGTTSSSITVTVTDSLGIPIEGKDITLTTVSGSGAPDISPSGPLTTNANGQVVFTVTSSTPGMEEFIATNTTDSQVITQTASVTFVGAADADLSSVAASPSFVPADGTTTSTITVTVLGLGNYPLEGKDVTLANTAGPQAAVINPAGAVPTDANGVATFAVSSSTPGSEEFTATVTTDSVVITQTASVNFVGFADANESTLAASPSSVVADGSVTSTITVSVKDSNGFAAADRDVTLANTGGPQAAVIDPPATRTTDSDGVVTFTVSSSTVGTEVFSATVDSVTITDTASVEFVDPAAQRAFNVNFWTFIPAGSYSPELESELVGPANGLGERWNQFDANSGVSLLDSAGVGTGVSFTTNFSEGRAAGAGNTPMLRSTLTDFGRGTERTFTISGLPPGALYDVWLASYRGSASARERTYGRWTANNPTSSNTIQFIDNRDGQNGTTFVEGYNYIVFQTVVVDESGQISFAGKGMMLADGADDDYRLGLSGFQLTPVGAALISSFGIPGSDGVIDQNAKAISLTVPFDTDLATLAPEFTLTTGTANQTSGAPPSPTFAVQNPATYIVTDNSTDPDTVNEYTVTVILEPAPPVTTTLVIDLGAGTKILGGELGTFGATNLPIPVLPAGSILRSIAIDAALVASDQSNWASDLVILIDPSPETPGGDFSLGITNGTLSFGETLRLPWPVEANFDTIGTPLVDTKTEDDWASLGGIDLATHGLFLGNAFGSAPDSGTWSGTITLTYDFIDDSASPFATWASGALFAGDVSGDGVPNGIAFLLGANAPGDDALGLLPVAARSTEGLVLTFSVRNASNRGDATLAVEHSSDLGVSDPWAAALVPETSGTVNGVSFIITSGDPLNSVEATIPISEATDGKLFGRLLGAEN